MSRSSFRKGAILIAVGVGLLSIASAIDDEKSNEEENGMRADLDAICRPEGRRVDTDGHREVERHLTERLASLGLVPYAGDSFALPYERSGKSFVNLIGVLPGEDREAPPILIGAHYDSVIDAPCADDNAAAVAIALRAAEELAGSPLPRDLVVALFDGEEPPYFMSEAMGSNRFFEDHGDERGFHSALILDLVGHDVTIPLPGADALKGLLFVTGAESHEELAELLATRLQSNDLRVVAALNEYVGDMSDHGVFRRNGVPYLFLSCGRWEHYHEPTDTIDRLNLDKMAAISDWLVALTRDVSAAELDPARRPEAAEDSSLALELRSLAEAFSSLPAPVRASLGLDSLETREDMTRIAKMLLEGGL